MLIFLILLITLGVLIIFLVKNNFYIDKSRKSETTSPIAALHILLLIVVAAAFILSSSMALYNGSYLSAKIDKAQNLRNVLVYRLEHSNSSTLEDSGLYKEIIDFNNTVIFSKAYAQDPWIGWYVNQEYQYVDIIEL